MRPASSEELQNWDDLVVANPDGGNPLQLMAFANTKAKHGWVPQFFMLDELAILVLTRNIPRLGEFWYIPKGPGVATAKELQQVMKAIAKLPDQPFAIRIDPELSSTQISASWLHKIGLIPAPRHIQYNVNTVIVDLEPTEEEILASLKQKTRYNIRLAAKKGVTVEVAPTDQATIDTMYHLTEVTTQRAGVYLRSKQYFTDFWQLHAQSGHGQMFFAKYEGQILAGAYVTYVGQKALYKDGGSVREHPEVQAPYALQWEIIRWLKGHGVSEYDLHGVPPADRIDDPTHALAGLARFKTGFQPQVTGYIGTYDLVLNQGNYQVWRRLAERLAVAYEYRVNQRLFY